MGKIGPLTFTRLLGIPKQSEISQLRFPQFICDDLATSSTSCKHLVNFGSLTPEFKKGKDVHPSSISSLATRRHSTARPCGISTEFSGTITTQFCFTYTLQGVTAMPRGLHARLCHAFLVLNFVGTKFSARMPLRTATSTFGFRIRQQTLFLLKFYLHRLHTVHLFNNRREQLTDW